MGQQTSACLATSLNEKAPDDAGDLESFGVENQSVLGDERTADW